MTRPKKRTVAIMFRLIERWTGVLHHLRNAWKSDIREANEGLRDEIKLVNRRLARLSAEVKALAQAASHVPAHEQNGASHKKKEHSPEITRLTTELNEQQRERFATLAAVLDGPRVIAHVRRAVDAAPLFTDPFPHIVVDGVVPDDVYGIMLAAIPPPVFFGARDPTKQNLRVPLEDFDLALPGRVWQFVDEVIARAGVLPALRQKFAPQLREHYERLFGAQAQERALQLPLEVSGGRLMLRRPGYHLGPHRDPKRTVATCLFYLAKPDDNEAYGTGIYRVLGDREASYTQTYYPEKEGARCELVKRVSYRPNGLLVFLNTHGAHGAHIPEDAPVTLERYTCQFYVAPEHEALTALIDDLPPERRAMWRSRGERES